jgi:hypothetical protein
MVVEVEDLNLIEDGFSFPHGLGEMKVEFQVVGGEGGGAGIDLSDDCRFTFGKNRYSVGGSDFRTIGPLQRGTVAETAAQTVLWGEYPFSASLQGFPQDGRSLTAFLV